MAWPTPINARLRKNLLPLVNIISPLRGLIHPLSYVPWYRFRNFSDLSRIYHISHPRVTPQDAVEQCTQAPTKVRMLVLETDGMHPEHQNEKGSFGQVFNHVFNKAGKTHKPELGVETIIKFIVEAEGGEIPKLEEMDDMHAILITGSKYDAHGDDEWIVKLIKLVQELWIKRPDIRFSGVCFGHQILCRALGSDIAPTEGERWELAHTEIKLTPVGEKLFETKDKLFLHEMHVDHVINAPSPSTSDLVPRDREVHVWGSSDTTEVQGVYIKDRLFTSQGHLGFDEGLIHSQINQRLDSGGIQEKDKEQADEARDTASWEHDGEKVAGAILRFFHGDDSDVD